MIEEFEKYIHNIEDNQIEKYTDVDIEDEEYVGGSRSTKFIRCSSQLFGEFIEEIRNNPNSSYESYANNLIKEGYVPDFLSVAIQKAYPFSQDLTFVDNLKDVIASRILNFFECPTIYVKMMYNNGQDYVCSLDFNKRGEDFYSFSEIGCDYGSNNLIEDLDQVSDMLDRFDDLATFDNYDEMKDKVLQNLAYSLILRKYILRDWDGNLYNMGIVIDKENKTFEFAPNFDFEYTFDLITVPRLEDGRMKSYLEWHADFVQELESLRKMYPTVYEKFVTKFNEFVDSKNGKPVYAKLIEKEIGDGEKASDFVSDYGNYMNELDDMMAKGLV